MLLRFEAADEAPPRIAILAGTRSVACGRIRGATLSDRKTLLFHYRLVGTTAFPVHIGSLGDQI
jgi:hypothetical protein